MMNVTLPKHAETKYKGRGITMSLGAENINKRLPSKGISLTILMALNREFQRWIDAKQNQKQDNKLNYLLQSRTSEKTIIFSFSSAS